MNFLKKTKNNLFYLYSTLYESASQHQEKKFYEKLYFPLQKADVYFDKHHFLKNPSGNIGKCENYIFCAPSSEKALKNNIFKAKVKKYAKTT